ncbi:MAG: hypothetical protein ACAH27_01200 [Xanthobacteraceae bacterium]
MTQDNTEMRARAICAADLLAVSQRVADISAAVERFWPVVALEIERNVHDPATVPLPPDISQRAAEYLRLRSADL